MERPAAFNRFCSIAMALLNYAGVAKWSFSDAHRCRLSEVDSTRNITPVNVRGLGRALGGTIVLPQRICTSAPAGKYTVPPAYQQADYGRSNAKFSPRLTQVKLGKSNAFACR